jgi:hypothetical protein
MDEFSYLSILLSIILGFSVTQLLQGLSGVIQYRSRVRVYFPSIAWALLLLLVDAQAWWAMFGLRVHHPWSFLQFSIVLLETVFLYFLAALVLPRFDGEGAIDLRENYFGHSHWFFACLVALLLVSLSKDWFLAGRLPMPANLLFHLIWIIGASLAALTRSDRFHRWFAVISITIFTVYIGLLFAQLK